MKWFYRKGKINIFAIFFLFSTGCEQQTFKWNEQDDHRWTYLQVKKGISRLNLIKSDKTGIKFKNQISDDLIASNRALLSGSGVALGDIDGDGLTDIYFCKTDGSNTLYRNRGGWKFDDITEESGVSCANQFSTGAVFADIDGDKDLDLLVTALGGPNALFYNDGKGHFEEAGKEAGFYGQTGATSLAIADIDQDGDLDILMGGNLYNVKPEVGIYDASYGFFIENTPKGLYYHPNGKGFNISGEIRSLVIDKDQVWVARNRDTLGRFIIKN